MDKINLPSEAKQLMLHTACDLFSAVGKQWLRLRMDYSTKKTGHTGSNSTLRELVQQLWLAHTHQDRRRSAILLGIQTVLRSTRHTARALFSLQHRD